MQIFSKVLTDNDVRFRFSFPAHCLQHLDFAGNNYVACSFELFVAWREMEIMTRQCFLRAGVNLLNIMNWELVTRLFFIVRMTRTWGHSSGLKLRGVSCCLVRRIGVKCQELTSYYIFAGCSAISRYMYVFMFECL